LSKTAPFPTTLRIGYRDYRVEVWPALTATSNERYAECDRVAQVIRVRDDLPKQFKAECLLHETLHAVYDMAGISENDNEERVVTHMSTHLAQVIRDNPHLLAYLEWALQP